MEINNDHIEHELFLLMLNLSQMQDEDLIKQLFLDSLNAITDHCQLRYLSDGDDAPAKILDIMTSKNDFGKLGMDYTAGMVSTIRLKLTAMSKPTPRSCLKMLFFNTSTYTSIIFH